MMFLIQRSSGSLTWLLLFFIHVCISLKTTTRQPSTLSFLLDSNLTTTTGTDTSPNDQDCPDGNLQCENALHLRKEVWVIPLMVVSAFNICVIASFEIFVLYKACGTNPSRRHLFLGQMLLLGLFLCSAMGFAYVPSIHWVGCTVRRAGLGLAYTLVFATLLVKCVFLLSLHGGVYLPPSYQGLLLFFAVAVQVAVNVQWLLQRPPEVTALTCKTEFPEVLCSLVYVMFLVGVVTSLAIKAKGLRENHREAMFIGIGCGATIVMWIIWVLVALATRPAYQDAATAMGVVCNATVIFLVMFLPKGRQLAAMGREGLYPEDRDMLSSSSPSIYTPSFLHLKPAAPLPFIKPGTLYKPMTKTANTAERVYYLPPTPMRVWRYGYSAYPPVSAAPPEDNYWPLERSLACNPNVKFFRGPLY